MNYTEDEKKILERVARDFGVPADAVLELVEHETAFHAMGRRRGLFPALRAIVRRVAAEEKERGRFASD